MVSGEFVKVVEFFEVVFVLDGEFEVVMFFLGYVLYMFGDVERVLEYYKCVFEFEIFCFIVIYNVGCVNVFLGNCEEVFDVLDKVVESGFDNLE